MNPLDSLGIDTALAASANRQAEEEEVGQTDFLQMLVAQLENQDPLNPQDSAQFAAQLAQFSMVEQMIAMRAGIDALVANATDGAEAGGSAGSAEISPSDLVGREVVVFGSQIEVDAARNPVEMPLRTIETATSARVQIVDENGVVRHTESILPRDASGREVAMRAGDHTYRFDPARHNLGEGVYSIEFTATGVDGEAVTVLPMVTGLVTGAILAGEPSVRMGSRVFPVADILEVRLAGSAGNDAGSSVTGGSQRLAAAVAPPSQIERTQ